MNKLTRRQFLGLLIAGTLAEILPIGLVEQEIAFVSYGINEEMLREAMSHSVITESKTGITISIDMAKAWQSVVLVDQNGNEWHTPDGETWSWDGKSIRLADYDKERGLT